MATIKYFDGTNFIETEAEDAFAANYEQLEQERKREEWRTDWRARKKLVSFDKLTELGAQIRSSEPTPEEFCIEEEQRAERSSKLQQGLSSLSAEQRDLVQQIYINNLSLKEIAEQFGVSYQAIQNRHKKILAMLLKFFD